MAKKVLILNRDSLMKYNLHKLLDMTLKEINDLMAEDQKNHHTRLVVIEQRPHCTGSWKDIHNYIHPKCPTPNVDHTPHDIEGVLPARIISTPAKGV